MDDRRPTAQVSNPILDGRSWLGMGEYYGTTFQVELYASRKCPGQYYSAICCHADGHAYETEAPLSATCIARDMPQILLKQHGLMITDLGWFEIAPEALPILGPRARVSE